MRFSVEVHKKTRQVPSYSRCLLWTHRGKDSLESFRYANVVTCWLRTSPASLLALTVQVDFVQLAFSFTALLEMPFKQYTVEQQAAVKKLHPSFETVLRETELNDDIIMGDRILKVQDRDLFAAHIETETELRSACRGAF